MSKTILTFVLAWFLLVGFADAAVNIFEAGPINRATAVNGAVNINFTVNNTDPVNSVLVSFNNPITLKIATDTSKTITLPNQATITLGANQSQFISFSVNVGNAFAGTYTGDIVASESTNSTNKDTITANVVVDSTSSFTVTDNIPTLTGVLGFPTNTTFTISNTGNTNLLTKVKLQTVSNSAGTPINGLSTDPTSDTDFTIPYGQTKTVKVNLNSGSNTVGTYTGTVEVISGNTLVTRTINVDVQQPQHNVALTPSTIRLGGSSQNRNVTLSTTLTVANSGHFTETVNVNLTGFDSKYNAALSGVTGPFTLNAGQSKSFTLSVFVPSDQEAGVNSIGSVAVSTTNQSFTRNVEIETASKLEITKVSVTVAGEEDSDVNNGETVSDDAKPGDLIEFEIDVKNNYDKSSGIDMDDVEVTIELDDSDFGDDITEDGAKGSKEQFDIDASDEVEGITASFTVPSDAEEGTYEITITAEGDADDGTTHKVVRVIKLKVEREEDDLRLTVSATPTIIQCERQSTLSLRVENIGTDDQQDVILNVFSSALNVNKDFTYDELDSDKERRETFTISLDDDVNAGTYPVEVRVFKDSDDEMDKETFNLVVQNCGAVIPTVQPTTPPVVVQPTPGTTPPAEVEIIEVPFTQRPEFIVLLVLANIAVLAVIIFMVVKLTK